MQPAQVLVTCVGSTNALSLVKALRTPPCPRVHITGVDCQPAQSIAGSAFCDAFEQVPRFTDPDAYAAALLEVAESAGAELILPILDAEVAILGPRRERFGAGRLLLPPDSMLDVCIDKWRAHAFLREFGFDTPSTALVPDGVDPDQLVREAGLEFPLFVKPRRGSGSSGIERVANPRELGLVGRVAEPLLQEVAPGRELTVDVVAREGRVLACVPRERLETRAGQVYRGRTVHVAQVEREVARLAVQLELHGAANVQGFWDGASFAITDINPRTSGGLPWTTAAGVNVPYLLLRIARGELLDSVVEFDEVSLCRHWQEVVRVVEAD